MHWRFVAQAGYAGDRLAGKWGGTGMSGGNQDHSRDDYSRTFKGRVIGINAGTGSQFSLLPAQNATGNWVKVTQRVPVRIQLDENPGRPLVAGWSAHVTIHVAD